jgi:glycine/D-amino acid oxidase-like deaminating enzyme
VRASAPLLQSCGFALWDLTVEEAARRFPAVSFAGVRSVYLEEEAGILYARRACAAVRDALVRAGGTYLQTEVDPIEGLDADVRVFACGPWLGQLFPEVLGPAIQPTRQEVLYFGTPAASAGRYTPAHLPVWLDFAERIRYGVPDLGYGFKLADDTRGAPFDPTSADRTPREEELARAREFLARRFPELATAPLLRSEVCQYENSPDGHLLLDRHPQRDQVWLVGGGSGLGFKLGPTVGELAAEAILEKREVPPVFRLHRLKDAAYETQFDRKR